MSLINDALKTAQVARSERSAPKGDLQMLEGFFPFVDGGTRQTTSGRRSLTVVGAAVVALAVIVGGWTEYAHLRHPALGAIGRPLTPHVAVSTAPVVLATGTPTPPQTQQSRKDPVAQSAAGTKATTASTPVRGAVAGAAQHTSAAAPGSFARVLVTDTGSHHLASTPSNAQADGATPARTLARQSTAPSGVVLEGPAPRPVDLRVQLGVDAMSRGDYAGANEIFKSAQSLGPSRELFYDWAVTLKNLGDLDGAATAYNKALAIDPTWVDAMIGAANVMESQGNRQDETALLNKAILVEPNNVHARLAYAHLFDQVSDYASERRELQAAVSADNTNAVAHYNLGVVSLLRFADTTSAVKELHLAAKLAGSDRSISTQANDLLKKLPGGGTP